MSWSRGHELGHGATATVYLATDHRSGERFAVKSAGVSQSEFLQREQRILSSLSSPYVIGYRGWEITKEEGRIVYNLKLEYMPGGTIVDEIRRGGGRIEESTIGFYTWQVVKALEYLHSNGLAHCDVKGRNILVGPDGSDVKLADFGCAKRVESSSSPGSIGGTPMFMAPETARGEEQGFAGDVWGLGCAVIEMATGGGSPWPESHHDDDPVSAIFRVGYSGRVPDFPGWMSEQGKDFLDKCLRMDPRQRWTASQLLKHPFLGEFEFAGDLTAGKRVQVPCFDSPTSILDKGFWNSVGIIDSEEATQSPCSSSFSSSSSSEEEVEEARERIGRLAAAGPSWEFCDGGDDLDRWITVRGFCNCSVGGEDGRDCCGCGAAGDLLTSSGSNNEYYDVINRIDEGFSLEGCKYGEFGSLVVSCNLQYERREKKRQEGQDNVLLSLPPVSRLVSQA
ncbi:unnamed protein product [Linum tenue]|uniref:Protein kinase domain-containing protein n=2 Tax=Linum tenue TaxID=586396 RepID=A0AAV0QZ74_9ROSI|nr:unnamed protein product [Linum tenue]